MKARRAALRDEILATFALSWPIVATNVVQSLMTATDMMMLAWRSPDSLAAGSLGFNIFMPFFLFCVGVVGAAAPIAASHIGAERGDAAGVGRIGHQALLLSLLLAAPIEIVFWNTAGILAAIGEPPDLAREAGHYMHGLQWALAPALLYFSTRSVFAAIDRTAPIVVAATLALGFNALANYALIFGRLGAPALGVFGSGLATSLSQSLMLLILVGYSIVDPRLRALGLFDRRWRPERAALAAIWRLGVPIGATIAAEISVFAGAALVMGLIGPASLAAHAIVIQIASIAFMVPLGLGQAASVRVGHAFGARDAGAVSLAGWTALAITLGYVALSAATMFLAPLALVSIFISVEAPANAEVVALALSFLRVAAIFQLVDGAQAALSNMLRGVHDSRWPMAMALLGYWAIGAPVGLALAFLTPLRGLGLWIGLAVGLAAVAAMLLLRWRGKEQRGFF